MSIQRDLAMAVKREPLTVVGSRAFQDILPLAVAALDDRIRFDVTQIWVLFQVC
jgi:hypothetical protein